jgi:hypothetical protein
MSAGWYVPGDKQLHSTYLVCRKAQLLNRDEDDQKALIKRVRYEFRQSVLSENYPEASEFFSMLKALNGVRVGDSLLSFANRNKIRLSLWRKLYHSMRFS